MKNIAIICLMFITAFAESQTLPLKISSNKRFFKTSDNKPFFWMGDTGWLLFVKCKREEAIAYLDDRKSKGFNVIQVMLVHEIKVGVNIYGDSSLQSNDLSNPKITIGNTFENGDEYDYWDNVDFVISEAEKRGIYMALVPVWGGNIKYINEEQAKKYATFLANRYKKKTNIIWLNGGDIKGADGFEVWDAIGNTLHSIDKNHLVTFHPRGRNSSSTWFHNSVWLDFNMFQSGHRSYAQDTSSNETLHYGEDNWRYVKNDYDLSPTKPTIDGEPSYEDIPYGLHNATDPYWKDYEIRRYAYWSVFAGGAGFTYGHNSVMQFYSIGDSGISFFPKKEWKESLKAPGASQMQFLKKLLMSKPYFERVPDQGLVKDQGEKYNYLVATKGRGYAMVYTYNGRNMEVILGRYSGKRVKCSWYNPSNGEYTPVGDYENKGTMNFDPPGEVQIGNDWVLVLQGY
jgi:hypothetical protein